MADLMFNVGKGKMMEYHDRVVNNDPTNAALIIVLLKVNEADATLIDYDDLAALLAGSNTEADFTNYARKVLTDADLSASTVDDANNRREADMADQVWTSAGGATNNTLTKILICYDSDTTGGTDANIIPVGHADFAGTTTGADLTAQINVLGYGRSA